MKEKKDLPYCLMPWIHFHVGDRGMVKACCVANIPLGNINDSSFDAIWNGDAISELRTKFSQGMSDPRCGVCINREAAGAKSIRQETFDRFTPELKEKELPVYFDIRFSNVCNFRCRTCWHGASSKWFQDARTLNRTAGEKAIIKNVADFDAFILKMGDSLKGAKEIYFAGGEPLVTEEHYLLLDWFIQNGVKPRLRYNTNFSTLEFKKWNSLKLWGHFPEVEIMASVDGMNEHGEYIRKEFDWDVFLVNREKLKESPHIHFKLAPTISVLNIAKVYDMYIYCSKHEIIQAEDWYMNLLERPLFYNIKCLPKDLKEALTTKVENSLSEDRIPSSVENQFREVVRFMNQEDLSRHYAKFQRETALLDQLRSEDWNQVNSF